MDNIEINKFDYGGSGAPTSAFYSEHSGPATTVSAQSVISTTENTFEAFIADNYYFLDLNEFMDWIYSFLPDAPLTIDDWVKNISVEELYDRLKSKIIHISLEEKEILQSFVYNLDPIDRKLIYYKNNLIQFVEDHKNVKSLYESIFEDVVNLPYFDESSEWRKDILKSGYDSNKFKTVEDWNKFVNKEYFMDPNDVPDTIKEKVQHLTDIMMAYIYVPYLPFDRIYRLKNFKRRTVTIIDTDSNILALDTWVNYTLDHVMESKYGRDKNKNVFIAVNTLTYIITTVVKNILLLYGKNSNIPEEFRPRLNMKNEFFFSKLVIGKTKKRYLSKILLREGNLMLKPKTDIKGFDFVKATTSRESEAFYKMLIDKYIMCDEEIDVRGLLDELKGYANTIQESIRRGEIKYLPITSAKELTAYKDPGSEQSVRGVLAWNMIYPNNEIDVPSKPRLLKLNIFSLNDIQDMKTSHPREYEIIRDKIFNDTTGIFVTEKKTSTKKGIKVSRKERGLVVLCIPSNKEIPDWCKPYIDYKTMIDNILAPFKSVVEILGVQNITVGKTVNGTARKSDKITNIVRF